MGWTMEDVEELKKGLFTVYFDNEEFESLTKKKGALSWHDFIINSAEKTKGFTLEVVEKPKGSKGARK